MRGPQFSCRAWMVAAAMAMTGSCFAQEAPAPAAPSTTPAQAYTPAAGAAPATTQPTAPPGPQGAGATNGNTSAPSVDMNTVKPPTGGDRRRAAKLYLAGARLFEKQQFEEALRNDEQAADLDPTNGDYRLAAEVARSHAVTALIQSAAQARTRGDTLAARAALGHALQLDPQNPQVAEHLRGFNDVAGNEETANERAGPRLGELERLEHSTDVHNFHLRANQRQVIQDVFRAYGIEATVDESIRGSLIRFDADDASFAEATRTLSLVTMSFFVPVDAHRVLVALDTRENRTQFTRSGVETVYLAGLTTTEMTDVGNLARNVFEVSQTAVDPTAGTLTLRAPESQLNAFNATFRSLMNGRSQVVLDVRLIQLAHNATRNTGVVPPQQVTAFNVYAEEQSILNANQDLVQQIISSGLAAPGDTLAILGILLASGQVSSSIFQNGIVLFGGGLTQSGLTPKPFTANLSLNSSDSRELDAFQLRLQDGEEGTLKSGTRYPIMTSSFSSLGSNNLNIPGLTSAGNSSSLGSILSSLGGASATIPQVQYEDLGLTLKATPSVMRSGEVAIKIDMKIAALAGSSINDVPVLANRAWAGVVTVGQNQAVVVASEMDKQESRAVAGVPGLSEIPGLNNLTGKDVQRNSSTLLVVITPHVVRSPRNADHSPMVRIERNFQTR